MLLDRENQYSDSQVLAAPAVSTNVIDHGVEKTGLGAGEPMMVMVNIEIAAGVAGDIEFEVQTSEDEAFTTPVVIAQATIPAADATVGAREYLPIPPNYRALRYTRVNFTAVNGETVSSYLVPQKLQDAYEPFQDNTTITG